MRVHTGESDDAGRVLQGTELHVADQVASAAELVVGPFGGVPAAVVRGVAFERSDAGAGAGLMPAERDLFRGADGLWIESGHDAQRQGEGPLRLQGARDARAS